MSADLLAEFDSFYQAPPTSQEQPKSPPAANNLSYLGIKTQNGTGSVESQWQAPLAKKNEDIWGNMSSFQPSNARQPKQSSEDLWGSFETTESKPPTSYVSSKPNYGASASILPEKTKPAMVRRDTLEMFSSNLDGWGNASNTQSNNLTSIPAMSPPAKPPTPVRKSSSGGDILFDADELSGAEDDDFGDFEDAPSDLTSQLTLQTTKSHLPEGLDGAASFSPQSTAPVKGTESLEGQFGGMSIKPKPMPLKRPVDLSPTSSDLPYPQAPKSPSFQERNPFADLGVATSKVSQLKNITREASPVTPWPSFEPPKPDPYQDSPTANGLDDDWGDFADMPPEVTATASSKPTSGIEADAWAWDTADQVSEVKSASPKAADIPPPTNIPPPSVLLPLFPPLFDLPQSALFKPVANQPFSLKNRILSDPSTIEFLRAYLLIATVAAHIIAGRKQRWKRDGLLSQSMKIGPAAAGGKGGMKLSGVDKAETTREDREATDLVRIWREQLGRLKSAVAVANMSIQDVHAHLAIPEIGEIMHVKAIEGGLTAPKQCVLCGLKREERVVKVDVDVEDSFGEWWSEHWGHRACRNFWMEHEGKLRHR